MKTKKSSLQERQMKGMVRNFSSRSVKHQRRYALVILMLLIVRTIKGKLGIRLRSNDGTFLFAAKGIVVALTANTSGFYTPAFGSLALLNTQATSFETAIDNLVLGVIGAEGAKTEAKKALKITLDAALAYVNNLAFLDQPNAVEIITGANMLLVGTGSINKQDFAVRQGDATGEIKLSSLATKFNGKRVRGAYDWQYSTDNGLTWVSLDSTLVSKTTAIGMPVERKVLFRKRTTTVKGGISAWSVPVSITPV
jgi:hypothetical protein